MARLCPSLSLQRCFARVGTREPTRPYESCLGRFELPAAMGVDGFGFLVSYRPLARPKSWPLLDAFVEEPVTG